MDIFKTYNFFGTDNYILNIFSSFTYNSLLFTRAFNYCSVIATRLFIKELFYLDTATLTSPTPLNAVLFSVVNECKFQSGTFFLSLALLLVCHQAAL